MPQINLQTAIQSTIPMETLERPKISCHSREFDLSFQNISYSVKQKHDHTNSIILQNLSGTFHSGRLVGILGPSGAGKSSLLNVLSGFKKTNVTGQLKVDGQSLSERRSRKIISYTPQEVCLWRSLTVEESLRYAAEFKLGRSSHEQRRAKVRELLEVLGLETCADTLTGDVSGGQAKRLSIGLELVSDPKVMLLDEPTSGLDSVAAYQVLAHVKELAARGRVIACVIHQPNSQQLKLIDDLFVLAKGRRVYSGPTDEMVPRFASFELHCPVSHNPADYAMEVACLDVEDERLKQLMANEKSDGQESGPSQMVNGSDVTESYHRYGLSTSQQFWVLLRRAFKSTYKDSFQFQARLLINIVVALLIGAAFYNTGNNADRILANTSVLIICLFVNFFSTGLSAEAVYPQERGCFVRESKNNWYSLKAYYWAKIIVEIPTLIITTLAFIAIVYYFTSQPLEWLRFGMFALVCIMFGWISLMIGYIMGSLFPVQHSIFATIIVMVPACLCSGFFVLLRDASVLVRPLMYLSFIRYGFEGTLNAIYGFGRSDLECPEMFCYFRTLKQYLKFLSLPELSYGQDLLALLCWIIALMVTFYLTLRRKVRQD